MKSIPQQPPSSGWNFYIIADLMTWATNTAPCPIEHFATFEEAKARFVQLRGESYNSEKTAPDATGQPYARLTLGVESADGLSAADLLHVRQGQNYLVDDFTRMDRLRCDLAVLSILTQVAEEIGFDRIRPYIQTGNGYALGPDIPFSEWKNSYFGAGGDPSL